VHDQKVARQSLGAIYHVLTQKVVHKILDFIKAEVDRSEMKLITKSARLDGKEAPTDADLFLQQLIHFGMAFFRNARGQTLAERWRETEFVGLSNDEQVAVAAYGRSFVSVLEVQDIGPDGQLGMVDVFRPESGRFLVIDRSAASSVHRFTLLLSWFPPRPHCTRISGVSAVHVSRATLEDWKADLSRSYQSARVNHLELIREEFLASTFYLRIQRMTEIGEKWQKSMLRGMDLCRATARFTLSVPEREIAEVSASKPDLQEI
jgi:hypothetical protein